jgi:hypothetical protein
MSPTPDPLRVPASLIAVFLTMLVVPPLAPAQVLAPAEWCSADTWHRECSTTRIHLALVPMEDMRLPSATLKRFRMTAGNVPAGRTYSIWLKPSHGPAQALLIGVSADDEGNLVCADSTAYSGPPRIAAISGWCGRQTPDKLTFISGPDFVLGEALRVALIDADGEVRVYADAIPYPLEASSGSCTVVGEMLDRERFTFSGSGFAPGETLQFASRSGRQVIRRTEVADSQGRLGTILVLPAVRGRDGGNAAFEVVGQSCKVEVRYGWGDQLRARGG